MDIAKVVAIQPQADAVIVLVKNGMAVQRQGGFLRHIGLVMQVLDAAKRAGIKVLVLGRLILVPTGHHAAGGQFDPVIVSVGAAFKGLLLRREGVARLRLRAEDEQ
jgi:hypothetical protein